MTIDYRIIFDNLFEKIANFRKETPSAGTKYRLLGLAADITEVAVQMNHLLDKLTHEALLDADIDIDYAQLAEQVLSMDVPHPANGDEEMVQNAELVHNAISTLNGVLENIAQQLERRHKDDEYERLYAEVYKGYQASRTATTARKTFDEWKDFECGGQPSVEQIEDYIFEKLTKMVDENVLASSVEHINRVKRYPGELNLDRFDDDAKYSKIIYRHYDALRKIVDYSDGCLVVNAVKVGRYFYASRHEANAKTHRRNFLKYMHKIEMAQVEYRRLKQAQAEAANAPEPEQLNYFAPTKHIALLLQDEWFELLSTNEKLYTKQWRQQMVEALMATEWGELIARDWTTSDKRLTLKCMIVGCLKDVGVIKGSYNQIAKLLDLDDEKPDTTLAKYLGMGKKQPYFEWISDYVKTA